jgi:hypothetical protein
MGASESNRAAEGACDALVEMGVDGQLGRKCSRAWP